MRTALQLTQRTATLAREIARYRASIEAVREPATPQQKRRLTMASKMLRRYESELARIHGPGPTKWRAMDTAPKDGTEIELFLHHPNRQYADADEKRKWEQVVRAKWIDFNGGGWTWRGMYGIAQGWRPIAQ